MRKVKLEELKRRDIVYVDDGFTCMEEGPKMVLMKEKRPYLCCMEGDHFLDGQVGEDGYLVGILLKEKA